MARSAEKVFLDRLRWCMEHGSIGPSDIARWTKRNYQTTLAWVTKGSIPRGPRAGRVFQAIDALEKAIKQKRGFPVPDSIAQNDRPAYIEKLRDGKGNGHRKRISRPRAAKKRVANRRHKRDIAPAKRKRASPKPRRLAAGVVRISEAPAENHPAASDS